MNKEQLAQLVREKRTAKNITQQELADMAGISLRSVQRMEKGEVLPRSFTLRVIAEKLDFDIAPAIETEDDMMPEEEVSPDQAVTVPAVDPEKPAAHFSTHPGINRPRKLILTFGIGLILFLGAAAYIAQSSRFPETDFERFLLWGGVIAVYTGVLYRLWK